jgi:hypothetical protein
LRLFTSTLDDKLLPFLEERNIKIEKPNLWWVIGIFTYKN